MITKFKLINDKNPWKGKNCINGNMHRSTKSWIQECIPVGCVPAAHGPGGGLEINPQKINNKKKKKKLGGTPL